MKSKERIEEEIGKVARICNAREIFDPHRATEFDEFARAIYNTLRWALGKRHMITPATVLTKKLEKERA